MIKFNSVVLNICLVKVTFGHIIRRLLYHRICSTETT